MKARRGHNKVKIMLRSMPTECRFSMSTSSQYLKTSGARLIATAVVLFLFGSLRDERAYSAEVGALAVAADVTRASMADCLTRTMELAKLNDHPPLDDIRTTTEICYAMLREQELLKDFNVRSLTYEQQYRDNWIILWMVVCITISGVVLSALQLYSSYKVSSSVGNTSTANTELTIAKNQIVMKSSVTGLVVMLLSFAFFLVFVRYVYVIKDPSDTYQPVVNLPPGTLNKPATGSPTQGK